MTEKRKFILRENMGWRIIVENLISHLKSLPRDRTWSVEVAPYAHDKTVEQRNYFHAICGQIAEYTGYTKGEVKEYCKSICFGSETVEIGGKTRIITKSSEEAKRGEYAQLIETAVRLAAEAEIPIGTSYDLV